MLPPPSCHHQAAAAATTKLPVPLHTEWRSRRIQPQMVESRRGCGEMTLQFLILNENSKLGEESFVGDGRKDGNGARV
jgi:hypothetical protein